MLAEEAVQQVEFSLATAVRRPHSPPQAFEYELAETSIMKRGTEENGRGTGMAAKRINDENDKPTGLIRPREAGRGKKTGKTFSKTAAGMYLGMKDCLRSGGMDECFSCPATPKEFYQSCTRLLRPVLLYLRAARNFGNNPALWRSSFPLIFAGLCSAVFCECTAHSPKYNTMTLLALLVALEYPAFPAKSVRPQITLAVVVGLSLAIDIFYFAQGLVKPALSALFKLLLAVTVVGKGAALYTFLTRARNTLRARKYLIRRVRLFGIPMVEPRRLGRDIRGRFLALGLIQLICSLCYMSYFIVLLTSMGYSDLFVTSRTTGISFSLFLLFKSITSGALFVGLALDTDPVLALAFFGCLGWWMQFVKNYTRKKRIELGGMSSPC